MSRQEEEVRCATWRMHSPDRSCRYSIQDVFFWRLAGPVAPTGKAIVHWIGCINAIKMKNFSLIQLYFCLRLIFIIALS